MTGSAGNRAVSTPLSSWNVHRSASCRWTSVSTARRSRARSSEPVNVSSTATLYVGSSGSSACKLASARAPEVSASHATPGVVLFIAGVTITLTADLYEED